MAIEMVDEKVHDEDDDNGDEMVDETDLCGSCLHCSRHEAHAFTLSFLYGGSK